MNREKTLLMVVVVLGTLLLMGDVRFEGRNLKSTPKSPSPPQNGAIPSNGTAPSSPNSASNGANPSSNPPPPSNQPIPPLNNADPSPSSNINSSTEKSPTNTTPLPSSQTSTDDEAREYQQWKEAHGKKYTSNEDSVRRLIWSQNRKHIQNHNSHFEEGTELYSMALNQFSDLTKDEFAAKILMKNGYSNTPAIVTGRRRLGTSSCTGPMPPIPSTFPTTMNWTSAGAVTKVKYQGVCGASWAFAAAGALEATYYLTNRRLIQFTEQQLLDCSDDYGNVGCDGGLPRETFYYTRDQGIALWDTYPYIGSKSNCQPFSSAFKNRDCINVPNYSENALRAAVLQAPVTARIDASGTGFSEYKNGIYTGNCTSNMNHAVLITGFTNYSVKGRVLPVWIFKNSWDTTWGDKGYGYFLRNGDGFGACGILGDPVLSS